MKRTTLFLSATTCAALLLVGCSKDNEGNEGNKDETPPKAYTITVTSGVNGTATSDMATATEGETITLTAKANNGSWFYRWIVEGDEVSCLPDALSNPATFTMPADDVSITAEFTQGIVINGVKWAYTNVDIPGTFTTSPIDTGWYYQWNLVTAWKSYSPPVSFPAGAIWKEQNATGTQWEAANDPCPVGWRVPTRKEIIALCDSEKTSSRWTTVNGLNGIMFTDYASGNFLFFPFVGTIYDKTVPNSTYYWSSTRYDDSFAYVLAFRFRKDAGGSETGLMRHSAVTIRCVAK